MPIRPHLVVMTTDPALEQRRRGFWLRIARERAELSQEDAAKQIGLSGKSKSTMSAWEAGTREIPSSKLAALARLYSVPVERFMEPAPTAFEAIEEWLNATVIAASALERADWARSEGAGQGPGDEPAAGLGKRSA